MKNLRVPLRIVFYKDGESWVAHCLEFDLIGDGPSKESALNQLSDAISAQVTTSLELKNPANLFKTADPELFLKFAAGDDVVVGQVHLHFDSITIDDTETREYTESPPEHGDRFAYA
jgi:hypothetical protein